MFIILGALLGLTSVMMGAYADHALTLRVSAVVLAKIATAIRYHQLYALLITMLGLVIPLQINKQIKLGLQTAALLFLLGLLSFCCGLYSLAFTHMGQLIYLTPIGGMVMMLGWVVLMVVGVMSWRQRKRK